MNSKERVLKTIRHQEPDRVALGYGAWRQVSEQLCQHLSLDSTCAWTHFQEFPEALLQRLHVDMRVARARYLGPPPRELPDGSYIDMWGIHQSKENYPIGNPLAHASTVAEIEAYPFPDPDASDYEHYAEQCERFEDYAVCGGDWSPFFTMALEMMGTGQFLSALHLMPDVAHALLTRIADYYYETSRRMFEAARGTLDIFFMGDDYGTQRGPFISLSDFHTFVVPHLRRLYGLAKSYGLYVLHHSCGSVRAFLPDMIALGMDALDPVQVRAAGMDIVGLKQDFGSRITFHGSIDTQRTLPMGSTEDVRQEVLHRLRYIAPGGGFILSGSQDYISDIPLDNIVAAYDTAYEYGHYCSLGQPWHAFAALQV
jgi:uroporphyrinogen decarboxylase